jgi:hypothetical protein
MLLLTLRVAGGPLDELKINFQTRCDFAEADRDLQLKKLDASYLAALDRQVEKTKATGKLDAVMPLIGEVQAVKDGKDPLPELPEGASLELKQMRAKHAEARAKILKSHAEAVTSLADKMVAVLKAKEQELTKAGKFDEALTAKRMRESLEKDEEIVAAKRNANAKNSMAGSDIAWRPLSSESMTVLKRGLYDVCYLDKIGPETKVLDPFVTTLKEIQKKNENILIATPNCAMEFGSEKPMRQLRGSVLLAHGGGGVNFVVKIDGQPAYTKAIEREAKAVAFEINFEPTNTIRLEVDSMGDETHDWSAWIGLEAR